MLDKMREGAQGVAAKVILIVIILSFALAGVSSYLTGGGVNVAVMVNGQEISNAAIEQAYQTERSNLQQQYGDQFEILASNPNFAEQVRARATQSVISQSLVNQAIADMGLTVGDEQVKAQIRNMSEFSVDGKFNNDLYLSMLRRASYTPARFSASLKEDLTRRQLLNMLVDSEFVMPKEVASVTKLQAQQRIAKILNVPVANFMDAQEISDEDIKVYYDNNQQQYQYPEQVSVDYILLDSNDLNITVTDEELSDYYDLHKSDYQRAERRKVAHILVEGDSSESKDKAETILTELNNGADFAELAKEKSDDTFSAQKQGELDWFERGVMDAGFDDAAFALTKDAPLSGVVKSNFGYHIIKLLDIEAGEILPFEEVKDKVLIAVKAQKSDDLYYDLQQTLGEVAFESPDSLDEASEAINSPILHTELFSADNAPEALSDSKVLQIVFSNEFREDGLNSDVIEISEKQAIVVHMNDYKESSTQPLAEVSDKIVVQLKTERAQIAAQKFVDDLMTKLNAQESIDTLLADNNMQFSDDVTLSHYSNDQDYQVINKAFKLVKPNENAVTYGETTTATGDFAVIALSKVVDPAPSESDDAIKAQLAQILTRSASDAIYQAFVAQLMAEADIEYATGS
jgi:peptidyl-prolyl cis-trans isomerase D